MIIDKAGNDMNVCMEYFLSTCWFVVHDEGDAGSVECFLLRASDFLDHLHDVRERQSVDVKNITISGFGNYERVSLIDGSDIEEGTHVFILVDLCAWNIARNDFEKEVVHSSLFRYMRT